jgi:hypothetical protein
MDEATLRRLSEVGLGQLPPAALRDLVPFCWDRAEATGDARFCSVARALEDVESYQ